MLTCCKAPAEHTCHRQQSVCNPTASPPAWHRLLQANAKHLLNENLPAALPQPPARMQHA